MLNTAVLFHDYYPDFPFEMSRLRLKVSLDLLDRRISYLQDQ